MDTSIFFFDYQTLRVLWWLLLGILLIGFAIMDGFDFGIAAMLPLLAKTDVERRLMINLVGPVWEGNQVWLITAGGAIFAAWPLLYAASFSGFYLAMLLLLFGLILRPVGFKYRSKVEDTRWRKAWDWVLTLVGVVSPVVFGVAFGNILVGAPFTFEGGVMRPMYYGSFWQLFTPFTVFCGVVSLLMHLAHGATLLSWRVIDPVGARARKWGIIFAVLTAVLFALGGFWVAQIDGHMVTSMVDFNGPSNPMNKTVAVEQGAWLNNFTTYPWMWFAPVVGVLAPLVAAFLLYIRQPILAFISTATTIACVILTVGFAMFPFLFPSSITPDFGLTVWDASSSPLTLFVMLVMAIIFVPIILSYTSYIYWVMRGPITEETLNETSNSY